MRNDRQAVEDALVGLFVAIDERDWPTLRDCFADTVLVDLESVDHREPQRLAAEAMLAAWQRKLAPIEQIHHQIGNIVTRIDAGRAELKCHGLAYHFRRVPSGNNVRRFVGSYKVLFLLIAGRWRAAEYHFYCKFSDGNPNLARE